jgi:hypothetical protein
MLFGKLQMAMFYQHPSQARLWLIGGTNRLMQTSEA